MRELDIQKRYERDQEYKKCFNYETQESEILNLLNCVFYSLNIGVYFYSLKIFFTLKNINIFVSNRFARNSLTFFI